ncbi:MAG: hypothetical protein ACR2PL_18950 [Dehalococcoidia bacterium]
MERTTWKASERRMAKALGGERVPVSGRGRGSVPDIEHPRFAIEHKAGRVMSARMLEAVDQAEAAAQHSGKLPLVTIEQSSGPGRPNRRFVLLPLDPFILLAGVGAGTEIEERELNGGGIVA